MKKSFYVVLLLLIVVVVGCNKNKAPEVPELLTPQNNTVDIIADSVNLTWKCSDPNDDILTYDLYLSTDADPAIKETGLTATSYKPTDLQENTTYYWKVVAKDAEKQSESQVYSFTTKKFDINDVKCVDYDGNEYEVVQIGDQIWMAENLRSLHYSDGTPIPNVRVYNDMEEYAQYYGRLYTWDAVMNGESSSNNNPSGVHGIAPEGWHIPSKAEWEELIAYLGGNAVAGGKMKETGTQYWAEPNTGATNESGFNGRGSGFWDFGDNDYINLWYASVYWTSTDEDGVNSYFTSLVYDAEEIYLPSDGLSATYMGLSVRCVKDK